MLWNTAFLWLKQVYRDCDNHVQSWESFVHYDTVFKTWGYNYNKISQSLNKECLNLLSEVTKIKN